MRISRNVLVSFEKNSKYTCIVLIFCHKLPRKWISKISLIFLSYWKIIQTILEFFYILMSKFSLNLVRNNIVLAFSQVSNSKIRTQYELDLNVSSAYLFHVIDYRLIFKVRLSICTLPLVYIYYHSLQLHSYMYMYIQTLLIYPHLQENGIFGVWGLGISHSKDNILPFI